MREMRSIGIDVHFVDGKPPSRARPGELGWLASRVQRPVEFSGSE